MVPPFKSPKTGTLWLLVLIWVVGSAVCLQREALIDLEAHVEILDYVDSPAFLESLREKDVPVMLRGTPAQLRWSALKTWKVEGKHSEHSYLSRVSTRPVGVKRNTSPKFPIGCCELKPVTQKEFWSAMSELKEGEYMYFNSDLTLLDPVMRSDLHPPFFGVTQAKEIARGERRVITNVWMGSKGSTAALHIDPFDNFFVQIDGRKKFTLFPPGLHSAFYLYPKTHPASRQSQVNLDDLDTTRFPKLEQFALQSGLEIIVEPGDVLYLPPYWFHQVESLDNAISVNTWFVSPTVEMLDLAYSEDLPFSGDWSEDGFALGLKSLITKLVHKVLGDPKDQYTQIQHLVRNFLQELVDSRFKPLYGSNPAIESDLLRGILTTNDPHLRIHLREQVELDASTLFASESLPHLKSICASSTDLLVEADPEYSKMLETGVQAIARHFLTLERNSGIQTLHLANFIEDVIGQVVGDKSVYHYIDACLLHPDSKEDNFVELA